MGWHTKGFFFFFKLVIGFLKWMERVYIIVLCTILEDDRQLNFNKLS